MACSSRVDQTSTSNDYIFFSVMMDDALSIYRHFISLDATQPLGVDESIRREVESKTNEMKLSVLFLLLNLLVN